MTGPGPRDGRGPAPIPAPEPAPPRRTSTPFPPTRHLPGPGVPHPRELGSDGRPATALDRRAGADFAYACDLFDHRYYWEAHEVWESEWRELDRDTPAAWFLQGLICAAAFCLKRHQGVTEGARTLLERTHLCLRAVVDHEGEVVRGVPIRELFRRLHAFSEGGEWPLLP
jgi:hypothetical protein